MKTRTTTIRIPELLYQQAKSLVKNEKLSAGSPSLNDLFVAAIKSYLKARRRRGIDDAFADMANDTVYRNEAGVLTDSFAGRRKSIRAMSSFATEQVASRKTRS